MTTKELVEWVLRAQDWHEKHWTQEQASRFFAFQMESLAATKPLITPPSQGEHKIAHILLRNYWNDCQDWIKEL